MNICPNLATYLLPKEVLNRTTFILDFQFPQLLDLVPIHDPCTQIPKTKQT